MSAMRQSDVQEARQRRRLPIERQRLVCDRLQEQGRETCRRQGRRERREGLQVRREGLQIGGEGFQALGQQGKSRRDEEGTVRLRHVTGRRSFSAVKRSPAPMPPKNPIRRYFITGLLVWVPIVITVWVLSVLVGTMDQTLLLLPHAFRPESWLGFYIPGMGVLLTLLIVLLTGLFTANIIGQRFVRYW